MCYRYATNPSIHHRRHCHCYIMVSPLLSHCHGFVVAITMSPLHWLQFRCRCHGVAFIIALSQFHHRRGVAFIVALLWCCCHGFVVAIMVLPSSSHCCGVVVAVALLWCLCCRIV